MPNYEQLPNSRDSSLNASSSRYNAAFGQSKALFGRFPITSRFKPIGLFILAAIILLFFWTVNPHGAGSPVVSVGDSTPTPIALPSTAVNDKNDDTNNNIDSNIDNKNNNNININIHNNNNESPDKQLTEEEKYMLDKLPVLPPYAAAPFVATTDPATDASPLKPWLNAIMISAKDVQRRALIRSSWLRLYNDVPFDYVFVIGNPVKESTGEDGWSDVVAAENRTYGDLVVLDRVYEGARHANTYKSVEFFRWLALHPWRNTYAWVSKVDGDSFVDARGFFAKYIEPRIGTAADPARGGFDPTVALTFIGRKCEAPNWYWAGGQFYTMSRDLVELLPKLQDLGDMPHPNPDEDIRNAMILKSHGYDFNLIILPNEEAFDYTDADSRGDGTGWAVDNTRQGEWVHAVGARALNPHKMKTDAQWLHVAACFDERGLKEIPAGL